MGNTFTRITNYFNRSVQEDYLLGGDKDNIQETSGKEKRSINQGRNHVCHGAGAYDGSALYAGGDVPGKMVGRDNKEIHIHIGARRTDETKNRNVKKISSKKFKDLKKVLTKTAKKNSKLKDTTSTRNSGYVPLQMAQYKQHDKPDEDGHLHTREEIIKSYDYSSQDYLQPKDFFEKAKKFICDSPEYKRALTKKAKLDCLSKLANVIGMIGQPGVGKSTLSKILLSRVVSKQKLYHADYIFYIKLRDFYNKTEMNLLQFLMGDEVCSSLDWMNDEEIRNEVLKLLSESDSVCILLDGLDEVDITILKSEKVKFQNPKALDTEKFEVNIFGNELPQKFILGLLSGQIFTGAKKLFTSRPGQMLGLPEKFRPRFLVQILGITSEGINKICKNLCDDKSSQVLAHIKTQPDLYSYMTIPIHCVLITNCIFETLINKTVTSVPNSITDVFVLSYFLFAKTEHMREDLNQFDITNIFDLQKICSLAWSGFKERQFYFGDDELSKFDLNLESISSFTVTVKRLNQENRLLMLQRATSNCTYFSHLLIQEFFAAIHCLFFMTEETFEETFSSVPGESEGILSNHYLMVVKFMFGLSNAETFKIFQSVYSKIVEPKQKRNLLKQYACTSLSNCFFDKNGSNYFLSDENIFVCMLAYELQNDSFATEIAELLPRWLYVTYIRFLPAKTLSFFYVLKYLNKSLLLNMICFFFGNEIVLFVKEINTLMKQSNHIKFGVSYFFCTSEFKSFARYELAKNDSTSGIEIR